MVGDIDIVGYVGKSIWLNGGQDMVNENQDRLIVLKEEKIWLIFTWPISCTGFEKESNYLFWYWRMLRLQNLD